MSERRRRRRQTAARPPADTSRYRLLRNPYPPARVMSDDEVASIHAAALRVLSEEGIRVLLPEAREILSRTGASIDDDMVRFDPEAVDAALAAAPSEHSLHTRNPDRRVDMGGNSVAFVLVGGPPHAIDLDDGKRDGTIDDYRNIMRLGQHYDVIHMLSPSVEPMDVPLNNRHLRAIHSQLTDTDKVPFVYSRGRGQVTDAFEMIRIANGVTEDEFRERPYVYTVINTNSPRQLDIPMCLGMIQFAEHNQSLCVTPFTLAGAMAPVTLAGALTLQHAEALAAITLIETVRPGCPVVYGAFTSNVDMRSGAPAFGTPEAMKAAIGSGQLARHVGLPWRSSGVNTANTPDAQAGYETMINMTGALMGGANMIIHAVGWLESGLSTSFEKIILDVEMCQIWAEAFTPITVDDAEIGLDAIGSVDPGGHFFGTDHTLERYNTAFYDPIVFSRENWGQWIEGGSQTAAQRANQVWKNVVAASESPPMDEAWREELDEFVERRAAEGGAAPES